MSHADLLLYPEDFADPRPRAAPLPVLVQASVVPGFTAEDVEAARAEGYLSGETAGRAAEAAGQRARLAEALARLAERLDAAEESSVAAVESRAQALGRVLVDALTAALPSLAAQCGVAEMRRVIAMIMPALSREASVTLHVPPDLLEAAHAELDALRLRRAVPPVVVADAQLPPGDIEITWTDGRAVRDGAAIWRNVIAALAPLGLPANPPASTGPTE